MQLLRIFLFTVAFTFTSAQQNQNPWQSITGWRPLLDFFRGPRSAGPPRPVRAPAPGHIRVHSHSHGGHGERFETAASQYQPAQGSYYTRNTFSHPFAHYRGPPPSQPTYSRIPAFVPIPAASPSPTYASYQHQQPIIVTSAAPTVSYQVQQQDPQPQRVQHVYAPIFVTAAPPQQQQQTGYAPPEPVTARAPPADFVPAAREPQYQYQQQQQQQRPSFDSSREAVVTPARGTSSASASANRYQSDTQISSQGLSPQNDRDQQYQDYEREILGNVQSQVQSDSQSLGPDRDRDEQRDEAPRLTPQNIRLVYHDGDDDEQEVRMTLREKSRNANEDATFIVAPPRSVHQKQRIILPPAPQPVVYILLRKPVITSEVKYERQEAEEGKKPKVYITYDDVSQVVNKHIDLETGKVKPHGPDEKH